ncbi:MAG: hypothetical protein NDJ24_07485 [Alphaproteobacteria bacterium]|nr:hypothetical protein [Alphaproteobacteria bacterium]
MKPSIQKASAAATIFMAAILGGAAFADESANKVANTDKLVTCVTEGVQESFRQAFRRVAEDPVKTGDEKAIIRDVIARQETSGISLACMSRISGIPEENMPSAENDKQFAVFYRQHFEDNAFGKALQAVGKIMPAVEAEGLAILKHRSGARPN